MHMHLKHPWRRSEHDANHKSRKPRLDDAARMRFVVDTIGRPLSQFRSTEELVVVIRDAIQGHQLVMEREGVLHRNVSSSSILIIDEPQEKHLSARGVLHDYDDNSTLLGLPSKASIWASPQPPSLRPLELANQFTDVAKREERTSVAYHFIAYDLLDPVNLLLAETIVHEYPHDLESFFWVLLWIVLRHTDHQHEAADQGYKRTFEDGDDRSATNAKLGWLLRTRRGNPCLVITGNPPLSALLNAFHALVCAATLKMPDECVPLTYAAVLRVFDTAIEREDWPGREDGALPFKRLPRASTTQIILDTEKPVEHGQSKKRTSEDDGVLRDSNTESSAILCSDASAPVAKRPKLIPAIL